MCLIVRRCKMKIQSEVVVNGGQWRRMVMTTVSLRNLRM